MKNSCFFLSAKSSTIKCMNAIAAVSGGPDSMALLVWMENENLDYGVCHVNYHKRASAFRDEAIVRAWCESHGRPLLVLHPTKKEGGNFQAWAREVRYAFFGQAATMWNVNRLYLGHQQDDAIETWMIQKQRQNVVTHYGLQKESTWNGLTLCRPLLDFTKAQLEELCDRHNVAWGLDESNLEDGYLRNRLRHEKLADAPRGQRAQWLEQMEADNIILHRNHLHARTLAAQNQASRILHDPQGWMALDVLVHQKIQKHLGRKALEDMIDKLGHGALVRKESLRLQVVDDKIRLEERESIPFWIESESQLEQLCAAGYSFGSFTLRLQGQTIESFTVKQNDFPLEIRPARPGDKLTLRYGTQSVSRLLSSRRIAAIERPFYPVISGKFGVFFVSLIGCDVHHFLPEKKYFMLESNAYHRERR